MLIMPLMYLSYRLGK
jgi:hypothetical protein